MTDQELLDLSAKAAGYKYAKNGGYIVVDGIPGNWNPLSDDGDALLAREWRIDQFEGSCPLPFPLAPVRSLDAITYLDDDGVTQTLAASVYRFDDHPTLPAIWIAYGQTWPTTRWQSDGIRITFTAGPDITASPPAAIPEPIRQGMLLLIGHLNRNRDAVDQLVDGMPTAVRNLWQPYRLRMGV